MVFCHQCGANITPDDPYCSSCGTPQRSSALPAPEAAIVSGDESGAAVQSAPSAPEWDVTEAPAAPAAEALPVDTLSDEDESPAVINNEAASDEAAVGVAAESVAAASDEAVSKEQAASSGDEVGVASTPDAGASAPSLPETFEPMPESAAVDERNTGEVARERFAAGAVSPTARSGSTGGRQATSKQLETGTVLNSRYEIVRRIGGGGMGAVYLAKDHNLGDAPRAVKEMVETHHRCIAARKGNRRFQARIVVVDFVGTSFDPHYL